MYAVIQTGGKQYKVSEGQVIRVEKLGLEPDELVTFDKVLLIADNGEITYGKPYIDSAKVEAKVKSQGRAKKIIVYKYKPKKGYHKKQGHRQAYTEVVINKILA